MVIHVSLYENREALCTTFLKVRSPEEISIVCETAINRYLEMRGRGTGMNPTFRIHAYYDDVE